jgi:hypothetical protein
MCRFALGFDRCRPAVSDWVAALRHIAQDYGIVSPCRGAGEVREIETPRQFFDHVVDVEVAEFRADDTDLRLAYMPASRSLAFGTGLRMNTKIVHGRGRNNKCQSLAMRQDLQKLSRN